MPNVNTSNLNAAVNLAKSILNELNNTTINDGRFADMQREGHYSWTNEESALIEKIITSFHNSVKGKKAELWGKKAISDLFWDVIFSVFGKSENDNDGFSRKLEKALLNFKEKISAPLKEFQFYFIVLGLSVKDKRQVGKITFLEGNEKNINKILYKLNQISDQSLHTLDEKKAIKLMYKNQINTYLSNQTVANVKVYAGDNEAAKNLALEDLQTTLDILNFYSSILYIKDYKIRVCLFGEETASHTMFISFRDNQESNIRQARTGPLSNFDLSILDKKKSKELGFTRLSHILAKDNPNQMENRFIYAARIAGKAVASLRREDAFLLYAIALESILLGGKEAKDLTLLLSLRCSFLLGKNLAGRKRIKSKAAALYSIRSAIAHSGQSEFSDEDLSEIKRYTQNVILFLLTKKEFKNFTTKDELNNWFEDKLLK